MGSGKAETTSGKGEDGGMYWKAMQNAFVKAILQQPPLHVFPGSSTISKMMSGWWKRCVGFKGDSLDDGFGGFDGLGGSGEHLALLLLVLQKYSAKRRP